MTETTETAAFSAWVRACQQRVNASLERALPAETAFPHDLHRAMRYSVLGGGKRMRPLLTYACGEVLGIEPALLDPPATAVELVHAFSLVHDDLPAMDDDDLRRGRATTHRAFDEATAILAGDALQVLAFDVLARAPALADRPAIQVAMVRTLADATGSLGMTGGQAMDLASSGHRLSLEELELMHSKKTGLLIRAAVGLACHCKPELDAADRAALDRFARKVGLAFQIRDDILDIEGATEIIGKPSGSDIEMNKATYPSLLGLAQAKQRAAELFELALLDLDQLGRDVGRLRALAEYIVCRDR